MICELGMMVVVVVTPFPFFLFSAVICVCSGENAYYKFGIVEGTRIVGLVSAEVKNQTVCTYNVETNDLFCRLSRMSLSESNMTLTNCVPGDSGIYTFTFLYIDFTTNMFTMTLLVEGKS